MKQCCLIIFYLTACMFMHQGMYAQQAPLVSHYMFNQLLLNPAYAGSHEYVSTTLLYRKQWAGMEGAPVTQSASIHGLIPKKRLGLGFYLQQDKIGVTKQTDFYGSGAYHLDLGDAKLSLGLQGGFTYMKSELSKLTYWDPFDNVFNYNEFTTVLPNVGAGVYYYRNLFYAGLSAPYMLSYDSSRGPDVKPSNPIHHLIRKYYFTMGGVIETEHEIKFKPSMLLKFEQKGDFQYDLNLNVLIKNIFWIGASYRSNDAIVALVEYQINRKLRLGYSYDYTVGKLKNYNTGSHEIMLGYDFGFSVLKMKSPRYF